MRVAHALEEATGFRRFRELYDRIKTMEANECVVKENAPYCSNPKNFPQGITEKEFMKLKESYTEQTVRRPIKNRGSDSAMNEDLYLCDMNCKSLRRKP